jgi:hypothetical protein
LKLDSNLNLKDIRLAVLIGCLVGSGLLASFYWFFDAVYFGPNAEKFYSIKLGGNLTYQQDDLTLVIGNSRHDTSRPLSIFGISSQNNWDIFSSLLSGESDRDINAGLQFQSQPLYTLNLGTVPEIVSVSVKELKTGIYHGWIYIRGPTTFVVPVTLSTDPKVVQAVTVVIIGVLLSIAFWEVYFYFSSEVKRKNANELRQDANMIETNYLQGVNLAAIPAPHNQEFLDVQTLVQDLRILADAKDASAQKIENRYLENASKIFTADVATIGFGILAGIVGLFNNNYVINLVDITVLNAFTLLGIGLAIGSLKGLVDKPQ